MIPQTPSALVAERTASDEVETLSDRSAIVNPAFWSSELASSHAKRAASDASRLRLSWSSRAISATRIADGGTVPMDFFAAARVNRSEEHTSELQSLRHLVC